MKRTISEKKTECEESKREYDLMVESNRKFYELHNKFREMYVKVEELERSKQDTLGTLRELKAKYRELPGTWRSFNILLLMTLFFRICEYERSSRQSLPIH